MGYVVVIFMNLILFGGLFIWLLIMQSKQLDMDLQLKRLEKYINSKKIETQHNIYTENVQPQIKEEKIEVKNVEVKPIHTSPTPIPKAKPKEKIDMANVFLGNLFNKIGAIAIIIALVIFIKIVSPFVHLTDTMKVIFAFIFGGSILGCGFALHNSEKFKKYAEVVLGTGFGILFISGFCGQTLHVYNTYVSIAICCAILLSILCTAHKMKTLSMIIIGLIGGYLTPYLSGAQPNVTISYLIFLNLVSIIFTLKNTKANWINIVNLIITSIIVLVNCMSDSTNIIYSLTLWAVYIIYDILRVRENNSQAITWCNYVCLNLCTFTLLQESTIQVGYMLAITAGLYSLLTLFARFKKYEFFKSYDSSILCNLWFAIFFIINKDIYSVISWSVIALILSIFIAKDKLLHLKSFIYLYYITSVIGIFLAKDVNGFILFDKYNFLFNPRTLMCSVPILSMAVTSLILKNKNEKISTFLEFLAISILYCFIAGEVTSLSSLNAYTNTAFNRTMTYIIIGFLYAIHTKIRATSTLFKVMSYIIAGLSSFTLVLCSYYIPKNYLPLANFRFIAYLFAIIYYIILARNSKNLFARYLYIFMGFMLTHSECAIIAHNYANTGFVISLGWVIYSAIITLCGIFQNKKTYFINSGIVIFLLTILRVFLFDLANVEAIYKLIAFLALGIALMILSYLYVKIKQGRD